MCLWPKLIRNPKYLPNKKNGGIVPTVKDLRVIAVPIGCGFCMECRKQKAKEWQVRLLEDVRHNTNGKFITLTFNNNSIKELEKTAGEKETKVKNGIKSSWVDKNGKLRHRYKYKILKTKIKLQGYDMDNEIATIAVRKFLERWRKEHKKALRHWFITELGHKGTENIHLHGIVWTDQEEEELAKRWKYGYIWIGKRTESGKIKNYVNQKTANYITKYVHKIDHDHKYYKPKILTSAGIGSGYLDRTDWIKNKYKPNGKTKNNYTTETGHKMSMPIYWKNKIYSDEEKELLWLEKLDEMVRWVLGEKIDISNGEDEYYKALEFARMKNEQLGYGNDKTNWDRKKYEEDRRNLLRKQRTGEIEIEYEENDSKRWNYISEEIWG